MLIKARVHPGQPPDARKNGAQQPVAPATTPIEPSTPVELTGGWENAAAAGSAIASPLNRLAPVPVAPPGATSWLHFIIGRAETATKPPFAATTTGAASSKPRELPATPDFSTESAVIEALIRPKWSPDNLSDPTHHDPNRFIYFIRVPKGSSRSDVLKDLGQPILSMTVIGKLDDGTEFTGSFLGNDALVYRVPAKNIIATSFKDSGSMACTAQRGELSQKETDQFIQHYGFYTPAALIRKSAEHMEATKNSDRYPVNEAFVISEGVEIIGGVHFADRKPFGHIGPRTNETMVHLTDSLGVPLLTFPR